MKKVAVSVINDLVTDQRVHKVCTTLNGMGFDVTLIGRRQRASQELSPRQYKTHRMKLLFEKGVLFYSCFQIRLFFSLLFRKSDLLVSNDLDTLLPNYLISRLKGIPLVYDTHEIFTEVPELVNRRSKQKIWKRLEKWLLPKMKNVFTVNESISDWYFHAYGVRPLVVRNMPRKNIPEIAVKSKAVLNLPPDKQIVILQGAGINIDRGAEELVLAMKQLNDVILLIVGSGDVIPKLKQMVRELKLEDQVRLTGKVPHELLRSYTAIADAGVTLDKPTNINYRLSLPNKIFDYIHAGIPVVSSDLPELSGIVNEYKIGTIVKTVEPDKIAEAIREVLKPDNQLMYRGNARRAAETLCWETEEVVLKSVYSKYL